jgi:hypothetical protein
MTAVQTLADTRLALNRGAGFASPSVHFWLSLRFCLLTRALLHVIYIFIHAG